MPGTVWRTEKAKLIVCQKIFSKLVLIHCCPVVWPQMLACSSHRKVWLNNPLAGPYALALAWKSVQKGQRGNGFPYCSLASFQAWTLGYYDSKIWFLFSKLLSRFASLIGSTERMLAYIFPWGQRDLGSNSGSTYVALNQSLQFPKP